MEEWATIRELRDFGPLFGVTGEESSISGKGHPD
jgi:hypothetical protein